MTKNITTSLSRRSRANGEGSVYPVKNHNCWGASIKNLLEVRITKTFKTNDAMHFCHTINVQEICLDDLAALQIFPDKSQEDLI